MTELKVGKQVMRFTDARKISGGFMSQPELEGCIDVVVTSPPYNVGKAYKAFGGETYDDNLLFRDYRDLLDDVFDGVFKALRSSGVFFVNIGDPAGFKIRGELGAEARRDKVILSSYVKERLEVAGFHVIQRVIWVKSILGKGHFTPSGFSRRFNNLWETVWVAVKDKKAHKLNTSLIGVPYTDKGNVGRFSKTDLRDPGDVWFIPYDKTSGATNKKGHPAGYPVELAYRCIKAVEGAKTVLDPFAGLGTTLQAAEILGIEGIGYELYPADHLAIRDKILEKWEPEPYLCLSHLIEAVKEIGPILSHKHTISKQTFEVLTALGVSVSGTSVKGLLD